MLQTQRKLQRQYKVTVEDNERFCRSTGQLEVHTVDCQCHLWPSQNGYCSLCKGSGIEEVLILDHELTLTEDVLLRALNDARVSIACGSCAPHYLLDSYHKPLRELAIAAQWRGKDIVWQ